MYVLPTFRKPDSWNELKDPITQVSLYQNMNNEANEWTQYTPEVPLTADAEQEPGQVKLTVPSQEATNLPSGHYAVGTKGNWVSCFDLLV